MKVLEKIYEIFTAIVKYFLFAIFFFATIFVVINVFGRKLFGFSFNWLEELNRYILIICTFLGASIAITRGSHPRMDSVLSLFKGRGRHIVEAVSSLVLTVFLVLMTYLAFKQLGVMRKLSAMTATLKVPVYVFFTFIPIGFTGMTVRSTVKTIMEIITAIRYRKPESAGPLEKGSEDAWQS